MELHTSMLGDLAATVMLPLWMGATATPVAITPLASWAIPPTPLQALTFEGGARIPCLMPSLFNSLE